MTLPGVLIPALLPLALVAVGYRIAFAVFSSTDGSGSPSASAQRLAVATLAGFAAILCQLGIVNFFLPLTPLAAALCLWPVALTLLHSPARAAFGCDLAMLVRSREGVFASLLFFASLALLVFPELLRRELVFYDGTGSHDGYFWISGAKWLQAHSYMDAAVADPHRPWANLTAAFSGWRPNWGRAGAETFLASIASLSSRDPVEIYLPATAALLSTWIAAVYLVARTFWVRELGFPGIAALIALQPLFIFFRANGNLPNLLGALAGAALVVATARALATPAPRGGWLILLALSLQALLHSYPEMLPFVAPACALLALRAAIARHVSPVPLLLAAAAGCALNPAVVVRAFHGFAHSFTVARNNVDWVNTFAPLHPFQYPPALATLSLPATIFLGPALSLAVSVLLGLALVIGLRRATDRFGAAASLTGGVLLLLYTAFADFNYGWQKAAQFSAVFLAAALPVALATPAVSASSRRPMRWSRAALSAAILGFFALATTFHALELHKWSRRKDLTRDWLALRDYANAQLRSATVLVEPATFPMAFFHGMWATYFLPDTRLVFPPDADRPAGYLHPTLAGGQAPPARPDAVLLGPAAPSSSTRRDAVLLSGYKFSLRRAQNIRLPESSD